MAHARPCMSHAMALSLSPQNRASVRLPLIAQLYGPDPLAEIEAAAGEEGGGSGMPA